MPANVPNTRAAREVPAEQRMETARLIKARGQEGWKSGQPSGAEIPGKVNGGMWTSSSDVAC